MKKQSGSAHAIIIIALILVVAGLLGFVFWQNFLDKKASVETSGEGASKVTAKEDQTTEPVLSANWLVYKSQNNKYSFAIPDGWHLMSLKGDDNVYAHDTKEIVYTSGTAAQVDVIEGGSDGFVFWLIYGKGSNSYILERSEKLKTYTTKNGVTVDKYQRTQTSESEGMDIRKGTIEYYYELSTGSANATITYDVLPGESDQSQYVDESVGTFTFL